MARLNGSTWEKQVKDTKYKLNAIAESKYQRTDHQTHSYKMRDDRLSMMKDFVEFARDNSFDESNKINTYMTSENVSNFLDQRIESLSAFSKETYIRSFSSLLEGLKHKNIEIDCDKRVFNDKVAQIDFKQHTRETGRSINDVEVKISELRTESSQIYANVQIELSCRLSEAIEVANNLNNYISHNNEIIGLTGKGGRHYNDEKFLSPGLVDRIRNCENFQAKSTYQRHCSEVGIKSHDFRYTANKQNKDLLQEKGISYSESLKERSQKLGHSRTEITEHYDKGA